MVLNFNWKQKELPFRPWALNYCSETRVFIHQNSNYTVSTPLPMRKVCLFLYCKDPCFGIWWALGKPSCSLLVVGAFSLQKAVKTLEEVVSQWEVMRTVGEEDIVSMWEVLFHNFKQSAVFWLKCCHSSENSLTEPWTAAAFSISLDTLGGDVILLEPGVELLVPGVTEKTAWEGEKTDHQRQETVTEKQRLEPASHSGEEATPHSRGLGCSTQWEKLL